MRSVLMLLGVVLHSARPYDSYTWRVKDADTHVAFDGLLWLLHLFRMPAFFVVAGYFTMLLLSRRSTSVFLRERLRRILVPLLVTMWTINVVQSWFLGRNRAAGAEGFLEGVLLPDLWSGKLTGHLWFLVCLVAYIVVSAMLAPALRRLTTPGAESLRLRASALTFNLMLAIAVLAPLAVAVIEKLTAPALSHVVLGLISPVDVLTYLPFFVVGVVLHASPPILERFARHDASVIALAACGVMGLYLTAGQDDLVGRSLQIVSRSLLVWMAVRMVFSLFRRALDTESVTFLYLSDASYTVYLTHHLIVVVLATWLLPLQIDAWIKFLLVLTTTSLLTLAIHHFLIRRSAALGYLFNGRALDAGRRGRSEISALAVAANQRVHDS